MTSAWPGLFVQFETPPNRAAADERRAHGRASARERGFAIALSVVQRQLQKARVNEHGDRPRLNGAMRHGIGTVPATNCLAC